MKFFEKMDVIDGLIASAGKNILDVIEAILPLLSDSQSVEYFFNQLTNAEWVRPLEAKGFFHSPPSVEREGNTIRHRPWVESNYLMRVADQAPETVVETIMNVPETENERVHDDFVEAALKMPVENAKKIGKNELAWIRSQKHFYFLYPASVEKLITLLAQNGEIGLALHLVEALLALDKVEREYRVPGEDGYHKSVDVVAKFSVWEYKRVVEKTIPTLSNIDGARTLLSLCNLLENAIEMDLIDPKPPNDYSCYWLPAIEDHKQNKHADSDFKAILAIAIREVMLQMVEEDSSLLPNLVSSLEARKWAVFRRMALFLLSQYPKGFPGEVAKKLTDKSLFDDDLYRHEYALLAQAGFGLIADDEKQEILSWVEAEPNDEDVAEYMVWHLGKHGSEASDEEILAFKEQRKLNRLWQFRNHLPEDWQVRYKSWVQKYNEPDHPDFSFYSSGATWVGPTSPKSSDDLLGMSTSEIVEYLKTWEPPEGHFVETPEGLSRILAQTVSNDPVRFATNALLFIDLNPTYVRGFIDGFREVAKNKSELPWGPLLDLFRWTVEQQREFPKNDSALLEKDPGWSWCRKSIAGLLSSCLNVSPDQIPFMFREKVWEILEILAKDPDPSEEKYGEDHFDPSALAINTVRGEAMHAVVNYGLWVVRHFKEAERSFDLMPELRGVLDHHLSDDPSLAIRSVYGQRYPWLHLMDPAWAEEHKEQIFSLDPPAYWDTAWKTYITFCQPFDVMLEVLRNQYTLAIEKIGESPEIEIEIANAEQRLSEHLLVFYWRGRLTLEDDLICSFYERASVDLKSHGMEFIGRSLRDAPQEIDPELQDRLKAFWGWRFEQAKVADEQELANYCWWFASGKIDADWALSQLKKVLVLPIKFDTLDFVAEELFRLMPDRPSEVLESLNLMIGCLKTEGVYFSWNKEAKQILSSAMQLSDGELKSQGEDIIHRLGAMGHFEFRELLSK